MCIARKNRRPTTSLLCYASIIQPQRAEGLDLCFRADLCTALSGARATASPAAPDTIAKDAGTDHLCQSQALVGAWHRVYLTRANFPARTLNRMIRISPFKRASRQKRAKHRHMLLLRCPNFILSVLGALPERIRSQTCARGLLSPCVLPPLNVLASRVRQGTQT